MRLIALLSAGALAAGTMAAAPADAQRYGYDGGYGYHHGYGRYHDGYGRGGYRHGYYGHGYGHGYYGRGYGYGYGHRRVICRIHRTFHGPIRRCLPIYR